MPVKRLKNKLTKENLWLYILSMLKTKPMYAYEIRKNIKDKFDFEIGQVTAYVVLYRLETTGYVETKWKEIERQRKYYKITKKGDDALKEGINFLKDLTEKLKP